MKFLIIFLIVSFTFSCTNENNNKKEVAVENEQKTEKPKTEVSGYQVGDIAEDFQLKNVDGNPVSLASYSNKKGVIVIFTCNHCPYSVAYEDRLIELNSRFSELGYPIVAVNPNDPEVQPEDSFEKMVERSNEKSFNFPYLFDESQEVFKKFGATKTPHVFLLSNSEKGFTVDYIGAIDDNIDPDKVNTKFLEDAVNTLSAGNKPDPSFTKAFGCSIKVKKESKS